MAIFKRKIFLVFSYIFIFSLFLLDGELFPQQFGIFASPGSSNDKGMNIENLENNFFETNFITYFGTSTLYEVMESTQPLKELKEYSQLGFYRTELVYLTLLSIDKKVKLKELTDEVRKGKSLREISRKKSYDFMSNFKKALKISEMLKNRENDIKELHNLLINETINPSKYFDEQN